MTLPAVVSLETLLASSVFFAALLVIRFAFRRTITRRVQYALWLLLALRLLVPLHLPAMEHNVLSQMQPVAETVSEAAQQPVYLQPYRETPVEEFDLTLPAAEPNAVLSEGENSYAVVDGAGEKVVYYRHRLQPAQVLAAIWYGGAAVMAAVFVLANVRFARKLRRSRELLADQHDCLFPVYRCDAIASPCLVGVLRPVIYVTSAAADDPQRLRYVLAHEQTHARHLDPLWSFVRAACLVMWWFNPLVWLAAHLSRLDGELACDEGTIARLGDQERAHYGEALLSLIPVRASKGEVLLAATSMTAGKREMKERILRIAQRRKPVLFALIAALALTVGACALTFTGAAPVELIPPIADDPPPTREGIVFSGNTDAPDRWWERSPSTQQNEPVTEYTPSVEETDFVTAALPTFPVTLNGTTLDPRHDLPGVLVYRDLVYLPLTAAYGDYLGFTVRDEGATIWIESKTPTSETLRLGRSETENPRLISAAVTNRRVYVDGVEFGSADSEHPFLQVGQVTYFPLSWQIAFDAFGWGFRFDPTNGLQITSGTVTLSDSEAVHTGNEELDAVLTILNETYERGGDYRGTLTTPESSTDFSARVHELRSVSHRQFDFTAEPFPFFPRGMGYSAHYYGALGGLSGQTQIGYFSLSDREDPLEADALDEKVYLGQCFLDCQFFGQRVGKITRAAVLARTDSSVTWSLTVDYAAGVHSGYIAELTVDTMRQALTQITIRTERCVLTMDGI